MLAMIAMTTGMSAQDNSGQRQPRMNQEEMVQQRTDFMAQQYGLNDVQKQQLLELNKKYADSIPMMMGRRPGGPGNGQMRRPAPPQGGDNGNGGFQRGQRPGMQQGPGRPRFDPEKMKEYEAGLSQIMTQEQYAKYEADKKARMERMQQRRRD